LAAGKTEPPSSYNDPRSRGSLVGRGQARDRPLTGEPPSPARYDDLPDNWRELDSAGSWLEACAEMRRKIEDK
jgi:hypothetical protein